MASTIKLDAREYKLLLRASHFKDQAERRTATTFWEERLLPIVEDCKLTATGTFGKPKQRLVQFWDTDEGVLAGRGFGLRWRGSREDYDTDKRKAELTLKLRTPDICVAGAIELAGADGLDESELEEDIAPHAVLILKPGETNEFQASFASHPSIWSRFSRSAEQKVALPRHFGELLSLYPTLGKSLEQLGARVPRTTEPLIPGPLVEENAYKGAEVELGESVTAELALSFWRIGEGAKADAVAEISFKCDLEDGTMPPEVARRACDLFVALQVGLQSIVETRELSKTGLAIPRRVGAP